MSLPIDADEVMGKKISVYSGERLDAPSGSNLEIVMSATAFVCDRDEILKDPNAITPRRCRCDVFDCKKEERLARRAGRRSHLADAIRALEESFSGSTIRGAPEELTRVCLAALGVIAASGRDVSSWQWALDAESLDLPSAGGREP